MATEKMQKHETQTAITMKKQSQLKEIWRRYKKNRLAMIGLISMLVLIVLVLAADLIEPYEVCITMNLREKLLPPRLSTCSAQMATAATFWRGACTAGVSRCLSALHAALCRCFLVRFSA